MASHACTHRYLPMHPHTGAHENMPADYAHTVEKKNK